MTTKKLSRKARIAIKHTKILLKMLYVASCVLFLSWIAFSVLEVWIHNATMLRENPYQYSEINFFSNMLTWFSK